MAQHMFLEPAPVASRGRMVAVSTGLQRVINSMLAKRAEDRPSVATLRSALAAAFAGTDADAIAERAVDEKLRSAGVEREDRALTGVVVRTTGNSPPAVAGTGERVLLWAPDSPRLRVLRDTLAVLGYRPHILRQGAPPTAEVGGERVRVVVIDGAAASEKLIQLRAIAGLAQVPTVVVDAVAGEAIAALIAAGVSDVAVAGTSTDEIAKKVRRVLKRGR
jgi:hypothetical protein